MNTSDTICSISTPQGIGAIAIVRMSGSQSYSIAQQLFKFDFTSLHPYEAKYAELLDGAKADKSATSRPTRTRLRLSTLRWSR